MKPSKRIDKIAGIFELSNTVGSTQLEYLEKNRGKVLDVHTGKYIQSILDYLDEEYEKNRSPLLKELDKTLKKI